jgi:hypothetical protein
MLCICCEWYSQQDAYLAAHLACWLPLTSWWLECWTMADVSGTCGNLLERIWLQQ